MTVQLKKKTVAINEVAKYLASKGIPAEPMNIGGSITVDGVRFTMTPALHSSWLEEEGMGFYGGTAAGFVITMDGTTVYHAGDTALFSDMQLIRDLYRPDVALLPVGGCFTMGPDEAMIAARTWARSQIPMHYDTFPAIEQDVRKFKQAIERTTSIRVRVSRRSGIDTGPESAGEEEGQAPLARTKPGALHSRLCMSMQSSRWNRVPVCPGGEGAGCPPGCSPGLTLP